MVARLERSCIVCRRKAVKSSLLRFVFGDGRIVFDRSQRLPGRGAYVHPVVGCVSKMTDPARWERAFRFERRALSGSTLGTLVDEVLELVRATSTGNSSKGRTSKGGTAGSGVERKGPGKGVTPRSDGSGSGRGKIRL